MDKSDSFFTLNNIVIVILVIVGIVLLIQGIWKNAGVRRVSKWPQTDALIINAVAEPTSGADKDSYIDPKNITGSSGRSYRPLVLYKYRVDGREYQSSNLFYSGSKKYDANGIKALMSQLQPGSVIKVLYNPSNPSHAYINSGNRSYTTIIIGIILLLIALFMAYLENAHKLDDLKKYVNLKNSNANASNKKASWWNNLSAKYNLNNTNISNQVKGKWDEYTGYIRSNVNKYTTNTAPPASSTLASRFF